MRLLSKVEIENVLAKTKDALETGWLSDGKYTRQFENEWGKAHDLRCCAVNSGTVGLELAMKFLSRHKWKVVMMPAMTVPMVEWAVVRAGHIPIFYDCVEGLPVPTLTQIKEAAAGKEEAIEGVVLVHTAGIISSDIEEIVEYCHDNGWWVLEDCSHAHYVRLKEKMAGTFGDAAVWSFYPTKVLFGSEGGIVGSKDKEMMGKMRIFANQGRVGHTGVQVGQGYNCRISELSAIVACTCIEIAGQIIMERAQVANWYLDKHLPSIQHLQLQVESLSPTWYKYTLFNEKLSSRIPASGKTHYPALRNMKNAVLWSNGHINLPLRRGMSEVETKGYAQRVLLEIGKL